MHIAGQLLTCRGRGQRQESCSRHQNPGAELGSFARPPHVQALMQEFCSPTKRSAEKQDQEASKRRKPSEHRQEPTEGSILALKPVSRAIHDHASLWEPSQPPHVAADADRPPQMPLAEGQLEQRDAELYTAAEQANELVDYRLHFFLPDRLPPAPLRAPPDATIRYMQREIERRSKLPRDRLQLQVTQPSSNMKVLSEFDSAGRELHLRDHGLSGPGLHNIWVTLRPLPSSPTHSGPPATFAQGSPAAEYQALLSTPPTARRPVAASPPQADTPGPSNDRADAARRRHAEQEGEDGQGSGARGPCSQPAALHSPPDGAANAGAAANPERALVVHEQQSSPQAQQQQQAREGAEGEGRDGPARKRGRPPGRRAPPAPSNASPGAGSPPEQKKRQPWTTDHLTTLIEGMEKHGTAWALILHEAGERLDTRTQVDLKDKWRNVAKTVKYHRPQRKGDLSKDLKDRALQLIHILS
ncbi:hypothetical protein WJX84_009915 [Apatococcus fuscideae]|uniref:Myb-like domain-containing protein n=1 Tax=Apatococcus fuscideae TaxID=2026836 RepID=A0AAW1SPU7_9CHLO